MRFRPIMMTSFAFILGVLPLVFATGAGAAARKSIGITVFSGMLASTCIAVLFVPALFVVLERWAERGKRVPDAAKVAPSADHGAVGLNKPANALTSGLISISWIDCRECQVLASTLFEPFPSGNIHCADKDLRLRVKLKLLVIDTGVVASLRRSTDALYMRRTSEYVGWRQENASRKSSGREKSPGGGATDRLRLFARPMASPVRPADCCGSPQQRPHLLSRENGHAETRRA